MGAYLTILGLYNYDSSIFDSMRLPDGVEKTTLVDNLLYELSDMEVLYADPCFMKTMIGVWSKKMLPVWTKLFATTKLDYDPISNYDRKETLTDSTSGSNTQTSSGESGYSSSGSQSGTDTEKNYVSSFNVEQAQLREYTERAPLLNNENSGGEQISQKSSGTASNTRSFESRVSGNIGVTTTQQMIEQERESVKFNIYDVIIADFKKRFCIMIY